MKRKSKAPEIMVIVAILIVVGILVIPKLKKPEEVPTGGSSIPVTQIKPADAEAQQKPIPFNGTHLTGVPHVYQKEKYPTGCESVAAVSMLQFHGSQITVEDFIDNHLPKADYPYYKNEKMYGNDPWNAFIGDPYSDAGYGCYSTAIVKAMQSAVSEQFSVHAMYNIPLQTLFDTYVKNGYPVQIWATIEMQEIQKSYTWTLPDGKEFTFVSPEHSLLLIGADNEHFYFCDSMHEDAVVKYPKAASQAAYEALHSQAIVATPIG